MHENKMLYESLNWEGISSLKISSDISKHIYL